VLNDITDKRELETDVLRHQRLESIGFLAGGIAHDFNNLLQIITGNLSLMGVVEKQEATPSHRDHLERIESAIERAKWITRQLLTFSEGGAPNLMPGQLPELVREVVDFTLGGSNVICEYNIQEDLPEIMLDDDQMRQAIQNLVLNARQAMPAGGKITIDIGPRHDASKHGKLFVELRITDTGEGIPSDNLSRVFDPYFTTREMARGLGLSIVFSIIRNHEGEILVESQPDLGTTFTLRFPAINATLPSVSNAPLEADAVFGSGRILYLEDDPMLIEVTEMMLTFLGYEMICVRDGAEAVEAYRERMHTDRAIDLLILDLTIPGGMGGIETLRRIRELNPSVIAILASGYATTGDTSEYESAGFAGTLSKPFYINEISQMLDRLLHAKK
jgi:CheY-like chemotaxis protein